MDTNNEMIIYLIILPFVHNLNCDFNPNQACQIQILKIRDFQKKTGVYQEFFFLNQEENQESFF